MKLTKEYKNWIIDLKNKIKSAQLKAAVAVNSYLIEFYLGLGRMISEKENVWGSKLIFQVSKDLKEEFPEMTGFSSTNLKYCKRFFEFYSSQFGQQHVDQLQNDGTSHSIFRQHSIAQIPWGHNILIFTKAKDINEALFYVHKTIENNWSRDILDLQIKSKLFERQGKAVTNFQSTLPKPLSDLAEQTIKDPYVFDFLTLSESFREKEIENQLLQHITKFLLELGKGFAFIGNQYPLKVAETDYFIDLLFYHTKLKCYVVIELKNAKFIPEFTGKLNFYLSAVDSLVKEESDNPTIGILLCKDKNNLEVEFALRDMNKPMGVSEIKLVENLPDDLKGSLPTIDELQEEIKKLEE